MPVVVLATVAMWRCRIDVVFDNIRNIRHTDTSLFATDVWMVTTSVY